MTAVPSSLERRFERWLWRFRLIAILPVVMSLLSAAAAFVCGTLEILHSLQLLVHGSSDERNTVSKLLGELLGELVGGVDLDLIGIAPVIFGYGVDELLISDIKAARLQGSGGGYGLLDIRSLDALRKTLVTVIVVALIVADCKAMLIVPINSTTNLLVFSGSVLLLTQSTRSQHNDPAPARAPAQP